MTRPNPSTQLVNPMPERTDQGAKLYIALLERRLMFFALRDIKLRAALELATGIAYDSIDFSKMTFDEVKNMIVDDLARGLNISKTQAQRIVEENQVSANPE